MHVGGHLETSLRQATSDGHTLAIHDRLKVGDYFLRIKPKGTEQLSVPAIQLTRIGFEIDAILARPDLRVVLRLIANDLISQAYLIELSRATSVMGTSIAWEVSEVLHKEPEPGSH